MKYTEIRYEACCGARWTLPYLCSCRDHLQEVAEYQQALHYNACPQCQEWGPLHHQMWEEGEERVLSSIVLPALLADYEEERGTAQR